MFTINAYHNPYLRIDQSTHQAVLSIRVDPSLNVAPAPLALAIALDRSGSMDGAKLRAARDGAMKVVEALAPEMAFLIVTFNNTAQSFGPYLATRENKRRALETLHQMYASGGTCMSTALNQIIDHRDSKGTIRLNPLANAVARKTLAINTGRTSKLK